MSKNKGPQDRTITSALVELEVHEETPGHRMGALISRKQRVYILKLGTTVEELDEAMKAICDE